ncbi:MAG: TIGR03915 family putative DNA repair protein, partial [Coriobacteriia bacterium]|nr:TIGR03915 family putative DNA repair protein [Coriobacteriia bacterium]
MAVEQIRLTTDGTLEGLLTAVWQAFQPDLAVDSITVDDEQQTAFFNADIPVATDLGQAEAMQARILDVLGPDAYDNVKKLYLAEDEQRGGIILRYLRYCLAQGRKSMSDLAEPAVADAEELVRQVQKEARYIIQFVRFADVGGGLFYSHIEPQANVIPLIMGHFATRFNIQPFVIHDSRHGLSGVFNTRRWWLV